MARAYNHPVRLVILACLLAASCHREPRRTASPTPSATPAAPVPSPTPGPRVYVHGKIVDLDARKVVAEVGGKWQVAAQDERDVLVFDGGDLRAIELATARDRWRVKGRFCFEIRLAGDTVYCLAGDGLSALERASGATRWNAPEVDSQALEFGRLVLLPELVIASAGGKLTMLAASDGRRLDPGPPPAPGADDLAVTRIGAGFCAWGEVAAPPRVLARCCHRTRCQDVTITQPPTDLDGRWSMIDGGDRVLLRGDGGSVAFDLDAGKQVRVADPITAVRRGDGSSAGYLTIGGDFTLLDLAGNNKVELRGLRENTAPAWLDGGRLIVGNYTFMSVGADLHAFDPRTGALLWEADVQEWQVAHSKYFNQINVELRGSHVLLWGHESANDYLQVFDARTGAREFVDHAGP